MFSARTTTPFQFLLVLLISSLSIAQTPGLIYKPAGNEFGRSILDPNNDGFTSSSIAGFYTIDYGNASEHHMVTLPVNVFEPSGDLNTGSSGGHTDIVSFGNNTSESCYVLYKTINNIPYLIVRFRLGGASTSTKGYSLLLDVDGNFGTIIAGNNPGFEKEIVLQTGANGIVAVYNHSVSGTVLANQYPVNNYHQRSIALSTVNGNADYFYDYYLPYNDLNLANQPVRIAVATVTSAASGIAGTISDFNGINDVLYNNNPVSISTAIINSFPATPIPSMVAGFTFPLVKSNVPSVNGNITVTASSISGNCTESNGTTITVYKNGTSIGTTTITSNSWTLLNVTGLAAGNLITAKATAPGKAISDASAAVEVTGIPQCYTPAPVTGSIINGQTTIPVTWTHPDGQIIQADAARVRIYNQLNNYQEINSASVQYIPGGSTQGTLNFVTGMQQNVFDDGAYYATVTYNGCTSGYSNGTAKSTTTITVAPIITTSSILASPTLSRQVQATNNHAGLVYLNLYINGYQVATSNPSTVAQNAAYTFNYIGFIDGDKVTVRAQSTTTGAWLSNASNTVTVSASVTQSSAPIISGSYLSGSGKTVSGTSNEAAGTVIKLYKAGTTLLGTTTVTAFNTWSIANLTLAANDVLTATAKAVGKTLSNASQSVTVASSIPAAPVIAGSYSVGANTISGTGGLGAVTVFVDGSPIGTATLTGTNWSITNIAAQLYKGAVITATNTVSGITSNASGSVTVTGVNSFLVTAVGGGSIPTQIAGFPFNIAVTARDGINGTGNTVSTFTGNVVISSSSAILAGGGSTANFNLGILPSHSLNLISGGNGKTITAISMDDPTATGTTNVDIINSLIWNGSQSTDWAIAQNWTPNIVPTTYLHAIIPAAPANQPHVTLSTTTPGICNNLEIQTGAVVTIDATKALTVSGTVFNNTGNTGLIVNDGASLLHTTASVPATVKRFISGNTDFHLLSVPVDASTFGAPFDPSLHDNIWIRRYDEPTGDWSNYFYTQDFEVGKGYSIYMDNTTPSAIASFAGLLNTASLYPALSNENPGTDPNRKGWNLLGNPYPSAIDWDLGNWNRSNIEGTVYMWKDEIGNYVNWNGTTGDLTGGIIPVAQGFFVKATGTSPSISIPSEARVHSNQEYYKNTSKVLRVSVSSSLNEFSDATFIGFSEAATDGFDLETDAWKLYGEVTAPQIYTKVDGYNLSINMMPTVSSSFEIPLFFEAGVTGQYTLNFTGLEGSNETEFWLKDLLTGSRQNILIEPVYEFEAVTGASPLRFKLENSPIGIEENPVAANVQVFVVASELKIRASGNINGLVQITNLSGQIVHKSEVRNRKEFIVRNLPGMEVYLVTVATPDFILTRKVFVN